MSYVGSRGHGPRCGGEINAPPLGSPTTSPSCTWPFERSSPGTREHHRYTNDGKSLVRQRAVLVPSERWHGLNTQYNYTLSKCTDYNSGNRDGATAQAANPYDPAQNKGPCDFDIRHNFNIGGSYEIPQASASAADRCNRRRVRARSYPAGRSPRAGHYRSSGQNSA